MQLGIIKITYNRTAQPRCYTTHFMDDRFVNLGEEVILTLLSQSGASESATVCFVISLSICYWLFKCGVLHVVFVCVCVCVCVLVCKREREGEREIERGSQHSVCVCVCVCARAFTCMRDGDTVTSPPRLVCKHIRASSLCLSHDSVPLSGLNWW